MATAIALIAGFTTCSEKSDMSKVISFEVFSKLVDEVLVEFRHILSTNTNVKTLIEDKKE